MGEVIVMGISALFGASALATPFDIARKAFAIAKDNRGTAVKLCAK